MVHITRANFKKIIFEKIDIKSINIREEIYKIDLKWFNQYEVKELLAFKKMYQNPEDFFEKYKQIELQDTRRYVWEGNSPAFHDNEDCDKLKSDYLNYTLPQKIQNGDDATLKQYREWFTRYKNILFQNEDKFIELQNEKFGTLELPNRKHHNNAGKAEIKNWLYEDLQSELDSLIFRAEIFYQNKMINVEELRYSYNWNHILDEQKKVIFRTFEEEFKQPIKELLKEFYRITYNPNLSFDPTFLEGIGFSFCKYCSGEIKVELF